MSLLRFFVILLLYVFIILYTGCGGVSMQPYLIKSGGYVTADRAIDADTIKLKFKYMVDENSNPKYYSVQYIGIKAPKANDPYYKSAKELNRKLIQGKKIRLEFDKQKLDEYGRLLAYVFVDDVFVNGKLIEKGYARTDSKEPNTKYQESLQKLEDEAKEKRIGIWGGNKPPPAPDTNTNYVASKSSKVFHLPFCPHAQKITERNKVAFKTFKEAEDSDRKPCEVCKPRQQRSE